MKVSFQCLIVFNGDGTPQIKANYPIDDTTTALIVMILNPFLKFDGTRERVLNGSPLKIEAIYEDGDLQSYSIGFDAGGAIQSLARQSDKNKGITTTETIKTDSKGKVTTDYKVTRGK